MLSFSSHRVSLSECCQSVIIVSAAPLLSADFILRRRLNSTCRLNACIPRRMVYSLCDNVLDKPPSLMLYYLLPVHRPNICACFTLPIVTTYHPYFFCYTLILLYSLWCIWRLRYFCFSLRLWFSSHGRVIATVIGLVTGIACLFVCLSLKGF